MGYVTKATVQSA